MKKARDYENIGINVCITFHSNDKECIIANNGPKLQLSSTAYTKQFSER